jgi:hypothetical protein
MTEDELEELRAKVIDAGLTYSRLLREYAAATGVKVPPPGKAAKQAEEALTMRVVNHLREESLKKRALRDAAAGVKLN